MRPLKLLGATAIDDKLQDEVPETIEQHLGMRVTNFVGFFKVVRKHPLFQCSDPQQGFAQLVYVWLGVKALRVVERVICYSEGDSEASKKLWKTPKL